MKNKIIRLLVLCGVLSTCTVVTAEAQRGHGGGGGGHFGGGFGGGGRVMSSPHFANSSPRVNSSAPRFNRAPNSGFSHNFAGPRSTVVVHNRVSFGGGYPGRYRYHGYGFRPYWRYYYPPFGFYVSALPFGYFSLGLGYPWGPMYYYGGTYYQPTDDGAGYTVAPAPDGAVVPNIPDDAQQVTVNGNVYYDVNGTYYQEVMTDNGRRYKVVGKAPQDNNVQAPATNAAPATPDLITTLPEGSRTVNINGQVYYLSPDGMYYQQTTVNGTTGYVIVGKTDAGQ